MNCDLFSYLKAHIGQHISGDIAADIMVLANQMPTLIPEESISQITPEQYGEFTFSLEKIEDIQDEIRPLHRAHWQETESHRHGLVLSPDYALFVRYERSGQYVLFTIRLNGVVVGNCAMYISASAHTKTLLATEDTLYLLPEARRGRLANRFIAYAENALKQLGVREIFVTVKTVNKAGRFFAMLGYKHVENGLTKVLED